MDEQTLQSLRAALSATPDNYALLIVVLRAMHEQADFGNAIELIRQRSPDDFNADDYALIADIGLAAGELELVLSVTDLDTENAELLLMRARALFQLKRHEQAADCYRRAIADNPTLEDAEFKAQLDAFNAGADNKNTTADKRPRLRVVSNDDTDASELVRLLQPESKPINFSDVGGLDAIKQQIHKKIILPFQKPGLFQRFKKRIGGGILLYGPPGCGKTLLARATAGECRARFFNVDIADVLDMYIGESERKLHALFEQARQQTPSVLFFDELEALGGKRQYTREGTSSKLVSQFLAEMDGFNKANSGVLILAATNVPWAIDSAFRRPGRFDRVLFVPPPDRVARENIVRILLGGRPQNSGIDIDKLARLTSGFSGADLEELVETAADEAIQASIEQGQEVALDNEHLQAALQQVKATTLEWLSTARNYARYANESGQYNEVLDFLNKHGKSS